MMTKEDDFDGQWQKIKSIFTMLRMWDRMHDFFYQLEASPTGPLTEKQRISSNIQVLLNGMEKVPSSNWAAFCASLRWTPYSAAAVSWCQHATFAMVTDGWRASGFPLKPLPEFERPARFINPALLPKSRRLSVLSDAAKSDVFTLCIMIAHSEDPLDFDIGQQVFEKMGHPQLAAFLKSRMLQKPNRTADEDALVLRWSQVVKGSEFDVWGEN